MTSATETLSKQPKRAKQGTPQAPRTGAGIVGGMLATLGLAAIVSGLAGLALNKGFHVSVPFGAGFFLVLAFAFFVRLTALAAAGAWFNVAAESASKIAAASAAGAIIGTHAAQEAMDAHGLLHMDRKIRDMAEKVDGGYL